MNAENRWQLISTAMLEWEMNMEGSKEHNLVLGVVVVAGCIDALVGGCTVGVVMSYTREKVPQGKESI